MPSICTAFNAVSMAVFAPMAVSSVAVIPASVVVVKDARAAAVIGPKAAGVAPEIRDVEKLAKLVDVRAPWFAAAAKATNMVTLVGATMVPDPITRPPKKPPDMTVPKPTEDRSSM